MKFRFITNLTAIALLLFGNHFAFANPTGLTVSSGSAVAQQIGSLLNIAVSQTAILNWNSFNIQQGETTTFLQPSVNSIVFNEIGGANPSQIFGRLNANGTVILANANGFYFGPDSMIKVGGSFIATTAALPPDFGAGAAWQFTGMPPLASIVNYGRIQAGNGKSLFLIAEQIDNEGKLSAPGGDIGLCAGQSVLVSERPDGRGLSATVQLPSGSINNFGQITADAGTIALQAQVVNQNGIIQADSIQNQNGVIELVASDQLNLGANSKILARGDDSTPVSSGGSVTLQSENNFSDSAGSRISVAGGSQGGNGGNIEISAPNILSLNSRMDARAQNGWSGGTFSLDPATIILGTTGNGTVPANGTVAANDNSGTDSYGDLFLNVNTAFKNITAGQILLAATGKIYVGNGTVNSSGAFAFATSPGVTWNLSSSTGIGSGQLTLEAGGDIIFGNKSKITDANDWSVTLDAGYNFGNNTIQSGAGNIYLNGGSGFSQSGSIQLSSGDINLFAGQSILVGSGSVTTTGGGNIFADALAGDINAGTANGGYQFSFAGYTVSPNLGGISTAAGGNVTLIAGDDIISTPIVPANQTPGASGAYGTELGNVTLIAGNQVIGNYNLANGTGTILAGTSVTSEQANQLQNPNADQAATLNNLELQVMQTVNPNANIGSSVSPVSLSLIAGSWNAWAANNIYVSEIRNPNGTFNNNQSFLFNYAADAAANFWAGYAITLGSQSLPRVAGDSIAPIYAPILSLNAGAGGVTIDDSSVDSSSSIILYPSSDGLLQIITRDGGNLVGQLQSSALTGITMSDSGSSAWQTFATGHANTPLYLNNLNPVVLDISGSIGSFSLNVPTWAEITVDGTEPYVTPDSQNVFGTYDFDFKGQNLSSSLSKSTSINVTGDIDYNPALNQAFNLQGLTLSGPGQFDVSADNINLGESGGIYVSAPDAALAAISPYSASLKVTTTGNLEMTATTINNQGYLGNITITVGGSFDVGGELSAYGNDATDPKGVFTGSGGNVTVTATGDVNVDGSRIAAYNGGNVAVESVNGDVNAGSGGSGFVNVDALELNPNTGQLITDSSGNPIPVFGAIPGSGILATTIFGSDASLGNITLNAPNGSVNASLGGIIQIAFNGDTPQNALIEVNAGDDINASGSGIIGSNIKLQAGGNINGLVIGSQSVNINSAQNVDVTAFSGGDVSINAVGEVSGTVISGGNVDVSGDFINASLIASSVSTTGDASGATEGIPQSNVALVNAQNADGTNTVASETGDQDDDLKKKGKQIALAQKVSRVTLILPQKN